MLSPDRYLDTVAERIARTGGMLRQIPVEPVTATMALFTGSVALSHVHYFVIAATVPEIDAATLREFAGAGHARATAGGRIGFSAASVTIAGLVAARVYPDAGQAVTAKPHNQWGAESRMAAIDLAAGNTPTFLGKNFWGAAMQSSISAHTQFTFPAPAEVYAQLQWESTDQAPQHARRWRC